MARAVKNKLTTQFDAMVVGSHPSASLAAMLLARQAGLQVVRVNAGDAPAADRLTLLNDELLRLDDSLADLAGAIDAHPIHGLRFLSNQPPLNSEYKSETVCGWVASTHAVRDAMQKRAIEQGVRVETNRSLDILSVDEKGVSVSLDGSPTPLQAKLMIVADEMPPAQRLKLGLDEHGGEAQALHHYSFIKCKGARGIEIGAVPLLPMALDLAGQLIWAWVLVAKNCVQFCVEQSPQQFKAIRPADAMAAWLDLLIAHGVLTKKNRPDLAAMITLDLPLAGALTREPVANRTLLIGPAGGFYTACGEEIYPALWSATFAVDVARKALKEKHLQDALQSYRQTWGSTLGDYLRGPQQNLRFLLPLVYRNPVMATRIGEAILTGKSVVR